MPRPGTPSTRMLSGTLWMVAMRWSMRLLGFISTVILARLLSPDDFGVIALALLVYGMLEVLSSNTTDLALIREQATTAAYYDTAWTISIIQGALVGVLILAVTPLAVDFFDEPRMQPVLWVLAFRALIGGLQNVGVVNFRKDLDFAAEYRFWVSVKVMSFVVMVGLAVALRSYWALAIGMLAGTLLQVAASFWLHPYRPRFTLAKRREIWGFSQWLLLANLGYFFNTKTDQFVVGGFSGTSSMGTYHVAGEIATTPTFELVMPMRRALFPNFAKLHSDPAAFERAAVNAIGIIGLITVLLGVGLSAVAPEFVRLVLGDQWLPAIPVIQWLALFGIAGALLLGLDMLLVIRGFSRDAAMLVWVQLALLVPAISWVADGGSFVDVAEARTLVGLGFLLPVFGWVAWRARLRLAGLLGAMWRPIVAGVSMYLVLVELRLVLEGHVAWRLLLEMLVGASVYTASVLVLWLLSGRPDGSERYALGLLNRLRG